jgi:hypothetical protein
MVDYLRGAEFCAPGRSGAGRPGLDSEMTQEEAEILARAEREVFIEGLMAYVAFLSDAVILSTSNLEGE